MTSNKHTKINSGQQWITPFSFILFTLLLSLPACTPKNKTSKTETNKTIQLYAKEVAQAAQALIQITPAAQRNQLVYPFTSKARTFGKDTTQTPSFCAVLAWCLPGWGIPQCDMNQEQLVAMHKMLNLALSAGGYQTLLAVLNRQRIIGEMEEVAESETLRKAHHDHPHQHAQSVFDLESLPADSLAHFYPSVGGGFPSDTGGYTNWVWDPPGLKVRRQQFCEYTLAIFGEPGGAEEWGFRFEGHHITVNMTFIPNKETGEMEVHATPLFFGAFPMIIPESPYPTTETNPQWNWEKGQLMMFSVAHHLRQFWLAVPQAERQKAFIGANVFPQAAPLLMDTPLPFMISSLEPKVDPTGINAYPHINIQTNALSEEARWHLKQIFLFFTGSMNPNIASAYVERLDEALTAGRPLTLSWAGKSLQEVGSHHYSYLVVGSLLLEFLQGNQFSVQHNPEVTGNHIHCMLRDLSFDWLDPMRAHHRADHIEH